MPDLLTTDEAASYLTLAKHTLEVWRMRREGPRFVKLGSNVRYRREDLVAFLEAGVVETNPPSA